MDNMLNNDQKTGNEFLFFEWKFESGGFTPQLINIEVENFFKMLIFEDEDDFLKLVLENKVDDIKKLILEDKDDFNILSETEAYDLILKSFYDDVVMSLLNDSLGNIVAFFSKNSKRKNKYSKLFEEMFWDYDNLEKQVMEHLIYYKLPKEEIINIHNAMVERRGVIEQRIPKILIPWYSYALINTYDQIGPKTKIIRPEKLKLKYKKSDYPNYPQFMVDNQQNFRAFIKSLVNNDYVNKSLNINLFNSETNLFDLFNIVDIFYRKSPYMKLQKIKSNSKVEISKYERNKVKYKIFEGMEEIGVVDDIAVKTFLIDNFSNKLTSFNSSVWEDYNVIFESCKNTLLNAVREQVKIEDADAPEEVLLDLIIYRLFLNTEPHENLLKSVIKKRIPVYREDKSYRAMHLLEAYGYAYKSMYKAKYKK